MALSKLHERTIAQLRGRAALDAAGTIRPKRAAQVGAIEKRLLDLAVELLGSPSPDQVAAGEQIVIAFLDEESTAETGD